MPVRGRGIGYEKNCMGTVVLAMQTNQHSIADGFRGLMAAIVSRALSDLGNGEISVRAGNNIKDDAMAWILGPDCEDYCLELNTDYTTLRKKAAGLYREFLAREDARFHVSPSRKPRKRPGRPSSPCYSLPEKSHHVQGG